MSTYVEYLQQIPIPLHQIFNSLFIDLAMI